jgi:single-strand DNA-binding protein
MKNITVAGRTGKPGELRHTQGGDAVLSFSIAVDDGYGDSKTTMWFDCSVWGKRAASLAPHIAKGMPLTVSGDLSQRVHEGKTYLTIRVNEVTLQGGDKREAAPKQQAPAPAGNRPSRELDDEVPF